MVVARSTKMMILAEALQEGKSNSKPKKLTTLIRIKHFLSTEVVVQCSQPALRLLFDHPWEWKPISAAQY